VTAPLRIAIAGASGRMGRMLIEAVLAAPDASLAGAFDLAGTPAIGRDAGESFGVNTGVRITDSPAQAMSGAQYLIDFTRPEGTLEHLEAAGAAGVKMVIGTTGFTDEGKARIRAAAERTAIVFAPNMSIGVNATLKLLEVAARLLGEGYDIEVIEAHHRHKVDAPSGTALAMGETIAATLGRDLKTDGVFERHGVTGERKPGTIGFATVRGGDIVGDHTVMFAGTGERVEITHRSTSRATYAQGALRACRFLSGHATGLYDMQHVLGLR
jgi:4-hydroxy-tetrahydrodipicolinate reductase